MVCIHSNTNTTQSSKFTAPQIPFVPLELILQFSPLSQLQSIYNHSVNPHFTPIRSNPEVAFSQVLLSIPAFHTNGVEGTCKRQIWRERERSKHRMQRKQSIISKYLWSSFKNTEFIFKVFIQFEDCSNISASVAQTKINKLFQGQ